MNTINSLVMGVPVARQDICNRLMEACNRGPNTFATPFRDKATLQLVGYLAHTYDDELIDFFVNGVTPPGITLPMLQQYGFATAAAARTAAGYIRHRAVADEAPMDNVATLLDTQGWELVPPPAIHE